MANVDFLENLDEVVVFLITSSLRETFIGVMDIRIGLANLCNFCRSSQQLEPEEDEGIFLDDSKRRF